MSMHLPLLLSVALLGVVAGCSHGTSPSQSSSEQAPASEESPVGTPGGGTAGTPAAELPQGPTIFVVRDSGIRCIAPPCPSYLAQRPDRPNEDALQVHELDLSAVAPNEAALERLQQAIQSGGGLKVEATVEVRPNAGPAGAATVLRARRVVQ